MADGATVDAPTCGDCRAIGNLTGRIIAAHPELRRTLGSVAHWHLSTALYALDALDRPSPSRTSPRPGSALSCIDSPILESRSCTLAGSPRCGHWAPRRNTPPVDAEARLIPPGSPTADAVPPTRSPTLALRAPSRTRPAPGAIGAARRRRWGAAHPKRGSASSARPARQSRPEATCRIRPWPVTKMLRSNSRNRLTR